MLYSPECFFNPDSDGTLKAGPQFLLLDKKDRKNAMKFSRYASDKANNIFTMFLYSLKKLGPGDTYVVPDGFEARIILTEIKEKEAPSAAT